ncbi:MAG: hypothetical protein IK004_03795 [Bacteroidales bacterium]|nr:hypothetical protein [Bacteroidales bacterium]
MKKLFITIAFVAAGLFASAQGLFVGGSLGMDFQKSKTKTGSVTVDNPKTFAWDITPSVGYMFAENMGAGIDFGFGMTTVTTPKKMLLLRLRTRPQLGQLLLISVMFSQKLTTSSSMQTLNSV